MRASGPGIDLVLLAYPASLARAVRDGDPDAPRRAPAGLGGPLRPRPRRPRCAAPRTRPTSGPAGRGDAAPGGRDGSAPARSYGVVEKQPIGELSRRRFLRRMLGAGAGLAAPRVPRWLDRLPVAHAFGPGSVASSRSARSPTSSPSSRHSPTAGPSPTRPARAFLINVPAAKELALGARGIGPEPDGRTSCWRSTASARTSAARCRACATI